MVEYFDVQVELTGDEAERFIEYNKNPWVHENEESQRFAKAARKIARELAEKGIYHK